jgi:signal transduction histidine kinase
VTVRARLTALYAALFLGAGAVLLGVSYWLVARLFTRVLPADVSDAVLAELRGQYALALLGATLVSVALGWIVAGRALAPLARVTATARRVSQDRLGERIGLDGPRDELRELAETFDGMLDRLAAGFDAQRRFIGNASHELRTPLTVIRTEVDVALADRSATADELRAMGEAVRAATVQCEALLEGLLTLARSESGLVRDDQVDLTAAAARAAEQISAEASALGVGISAPKFGDGPRISVRGDGPLLERLIANLLENGVRHNRPDGWVSSSVERLGSVARLRAENTGDVISPRDAARLVEPFQRLTRRAGGGAGLGLSIVRTVTHAHGGTLTVLPRAGGGLVVTVDLPVSSAPAAPAAAAPAPRRGAGSAAGEAR